MILLNQLDFEAAAHPFQLTLTASDGTESNAVAITVNVLDETGPTFSESLFSFSASEYSGVGSVLGVVSALDTDNVGGRGSVPVTLSIASNPFLKLVGTGGTANVVLVAPMDFETIPLIQAVVTASDGFETISTQIEVNVLDENGPVFSAASYTFQISERANLSSSVGLISAMDSNNVGGRGSVTLSLSLLSQHPYVLLESSGGSGIILLGKLLDFENETERSFTFVVMASDGFETTTVFCFCHFFFVFFSNFEVLI